MGRHSTTRKHTSTLANVVALTAACGLWVGTMALTAPQPTEEQTHAAGYVEHTNTELPKALKANRFACWVEKWQHVDTAEGVCGRPDQRPAGSVDLGAQVLVNGRPWVATLTGLEPVGAN